MSGFGEFINQDRTSGLVKILASKEEDVRNDFNLKLKDAGLYYDGEVYPICTNPVILADSAQGKLNEVSENFTNLVNDFVEIARDDNRVIKKIVSENPAYPLLEENLYKLRREDVENIFYRLDGIIEDNELKIIEANMSSPGGTFSLDNLEKIGAEIYLEKLGLSDLNYSRVSENVMDHFVNNYSKFKNGEKFLVIGKEEDSERAEHLLWSEKLRAKGIPALTIDYRDSKVGFDNEMLTYDGEKVGVVYRRVFPLEYSSDMLVADSKHNTVFLNPTVSYLLGSKSLFAMFHEMKDSELINHRDFIEKNIPYTAFVGSLDRDFISSQKDSYVLKEVGKSGGEGVYVGRGESLEKWARIVNSASSGSIVQKYYPQPEMEFYDNRSNGAALRKFDFNLYCLGSEVISPYIRVNAPNSFKSNSSCGASDALCYMEGKNE